MLGIPSAGTAQGTLGVDPTLRERRPLLPDERVPAPPGEVLPRLPAPAPPDRPGTLSTLRVFVREIRVTGVTVFSPDEIAALTAPYVGRELSTEDLEALRTELTLFYVRRGYINSGAIIPDQTISDGVVTLQVIEGRLSRIDVEGDTWFRDAYLRSRVALGAAPPLNVHALQERLRLLQQDPRVARLDAELRPGVERGDSVLTLRVEDRPPFRIALEADNYQSPAIGEERGTLALEHQNVTGNGDVLALRLGRSEGVDRQLSVRYSLPVTPHDTTVSVQYRQTSFRVIEPPFEDLDIRSESEIYTISVRHPFYRTVGRELAGELVAERLANQTSLLGERFTLSPGARTGESVVTALRFVQEYVERTQEQVIAFRSRLSAGIDVLDATVNRSDTTDHRGRRIVTPDSRFFAWLGQAQWVRRLPWDIQGILRADLQLTNRPLLSLEQIPIGGRYSVRGYRENAVVSDNGVLTSLEVRVPIVRKTSWADAVELAPFLDYGRGWNDNAPPPGPQALLSVGAGVRWSVTLPPWNVRPQFEFYWGKRLIEDDTRNTHKHLQDHGIHLQAAVSFF